MHQRAAAELSALTLSPHVVVWESTRACDFACRHCRADAIPYRLPGELSTDEARGIIDQLADNSVRLFVISGGDALKRDDIFELIGYASARLRTALSPSGSKIDSSAAENIRKAGASIVSISVDGPQPVHDEFRGVNGAFSIASGAIASLQSAGVPVQINSTLSVYNINRLTELKETVLSMKPDFWDLFMIVPTGRATAEMALTQEQANTAMRTVAAWRAEGLQVRMTCAPYLIRIMSENGAKLQKPDETGRKSVNGARGCMAGNGYSFISYDGTVYPCGFLPLPAGSIRKSSFAEIYNGKLFSELRDSSLLGGKCGICNFRTVCGGCRARAYASTGDWMAEDSLCDYSVRGGGA